MLSESTPLSDSRTVREFLEKHYKDEEVATENGAVKLAIKALLEVAQSGQKDLEIAVMEKNKPLKMLDVQTIEQYVADLDLMLYEFTPGSDSRRINLKRILVLRKKISALFLLNRRGFMPEL